MSPKRFFLVQLRAKKITLHLLTKKASNLKEYGFQILWKLIPVCLCKFVSDMLSLIT